VTYPPTASTIDRRSTMRCRAMKSQTPITIRSRSHRCIRILVLPRDSNPYQELLYSPMRADHPDDFRMIYWKRRPWIGLPMFFVVSAWAALRGARIVHLHWVAWDIRLSIPGRAFLSGFLSRIAIRWLELLRFRLICTIHNVVPHEPQTNDDLAIARRLCKSADALIVHSETARSALREQGLEAKSIVVIPHGSYLDVYSQPPAKPKARKALGLPSGSRIVLFFGNIRPYKGIMDLLDAWDQRVNDGLLLIAGSCADPDLESAIHEAALRDASIICHLGYIADNDVSTFFAASDGVCLPFRHVATSGSAILALTFDKPLVAPRIGAIQDLPESTGFYYRSSQENGLECALGRFFGATEFELKSRSASCADYMAALSWSSIADATFALYESIYLSDPAN
jgi:glycosyltransferase involved in cell wall biosynthesis